MNLKNIFGALRRRWWAAGLVLGVTAAAVVWVVSNTADQYQATATLLLAGPEIMGLEGQPAEDEATEEEATEDEVSQGGVNDVRLDPNVVVEIANGDSVRSRLGIEGVEYSVISVGEGILRVEALSDSEEGVVETALAVIEEIERIAEDLEASDPVSTAEITILSQPQFVRERAIEPSPDGEDPGDQEDQVEYVAVGSVFLAVDEAPDEAPQGNPYTASDGTLRVIQEVASTDQAREAVLGGIEDETASFAMVMQPRDAVPFVYVEATAGSPEATMATLDAAVSFLDEALAQRQSITGADESTWLAFQRIAVDEEAELMAVRLGRPIATVLVLGVVAAVSLALLVDSLFYTRASAHLAGSKSVSEEASVESERSRAS